MIKIKSSQYMIEAEGHADADVYGKDIVCASVSALMLTLAENIRSYKTQGYIKSSEIIIKSGYAIVRCVPKGVAEGKIQATFDTIRNGLKYLSELKSEYITYEETT